MYFKSSPILWLATHEPKSFRLFNSPSNSIKITLRQCPSLLFVHARLLEEKQFVKLCACLCSCDQQGLEQRPPCLLPDENFNLHNRKAHTANSLCEFTFGKLDLWECALGPAAAASARKGLPAFLSRLHAQMRRLVRRPLCTRLSRFGYNYIQLTLYGNLHMHARDQNLCQKQCWGILHFQSATHSRAREIIYA